jgi:hypothetical protein
METTRGQGWVQIDLINQKLVLTGYSLQLKAPDRELRWTIRGSDDARKDVKDWPVIGKVETWKGDSANKMKVEALGGPFRYFRLVRESDDTELTVTYFDVFGGVLTP